MLGDEWRQCTKGQSKMQEDCALIDSCVNEVASY